MEIGLVSKMLAKLKKKAPRTNWGPSFVPRFGAPGGIRTHNPWVRSPVLYPLSYRRRWWTTTDLGRATGFEPVISCATDRRLGPLGYARHERAYACRTALNRPAAATPFGLVTIQLEYRSKKPVSLQDKPGLS